MNDNNSISIAINDNKNVKKLIQQQYDELDVQEQRYAKQAIQIKFIYYTFGLIALITSVLITSMTASYKNTTERDNLVVFCLSVIVSIITSALNFLQIETKMSSYQNTKKQYHDLKLTIHNFWGHNKDDEQCEIFYDKIIQQQRKIENNSLDINPCFCLSCCF